MTTHVLQNLHSTRFSVNSQTGIPTCCECGDFHHSACYFKGKCR